MPTQLLLEGPDIEVLLARVREEHGPDVRIVAADKVRSGGFAGFFAHERYAVTIEVGDVATDSPVQVPAEPTVIALPPASPRTSWPGPGTNGHWAPPVDLGATAVAEPGSLLDMAAAIDAAEAAEAEVIMSTAPMGRPAYSGPPPVLSTDGAEFAEVLAGLARSTQVVTPVNGHASTLRPFVPISILRSALNAAAQSQPRGGRAGSGVPDRVPVAVGVPIVPEPTVAAPTAAAPTAAAPTAPAPVVRAPSAVAPRTVASRLLALGLPVQIADRLGCDGSTDLRADLLDALSDLPPSRPLDLKAGDVLVIAGPGAVALDVARSVSQRMRLDPARVLLVAPSALGTGLGQAMMLSGPAKARRRSACIHRSELPTIVAVDAPFDGTSGEWVREVADALGARTVWALADATRKPADLTDHLLTLGRIDGLVVAGTAASRDPASVLSTSIDLAVPTVLLEGRPADPATWSSLLLERLGDLP